MKKTLYQVLGVEPNATDAQIAEAYMRLQAELAAAEFDRNAQIIAKEAFAVLSNPTKRAMYDNSLVAKSPAAPVIMVDRTPERASLDWRHGVVIALVVGVVSGWWFSRPKAIPDAEPDPVPIAARANDAVQPPAQAIAQPALPSADANTLELNSETLFAKLSPSIVRINVGSGGGRPSAIGSGVVIGPGVVITNCHVAEAGASLQVKSGDTSYNARIAVADQEHDLCKLDVPQLRAPAVAIGASRHLRTGQKVVAIGGPKGLDLTISEGIISSLRQVDDGTLIQTTAPVSPGSSGGGLFDMRGELVGIVTFQMSSGQNLNFAAPAEWIDSMQATRGTGVIGKLTGKSGMPGNAEVEGGGGLTGNLMGRWACRDTIRGTVFDIDFEPNGRVEMRKAGSTQPGAWRLNGERIEVKTVATPLFQVEYLSPEKMILYFGEGFRSACLRR